MALRDLVRVKKTQRDKDWPMVRRLVEADIAGARWRGAQDRVVFWLRECRTPETLIELASRFPDLARVEARTRAAIRAARRNEHDEVESALRTEEDRERRADRKYWAPLKRELEDWRATRARQNRA
jgi:hypothetical protein